jgi:hypothetical protein
MAWIYGRIGGRTDYVPAADGEWMPESLVSPQQQ